MFKFKGKVDLATKRTMAAMLVMAMITTCLVVFSALTAQAADAPEWSVGFPRLVEKNVLLQWNLVDGADSYNVYKSTQKDKDLKLLATVKVNRHIDKGVAGGKTLYYYIAAVAAGAEGPRSKAGAITTPLEKVFVPLTKPTLAGGHVRRVADKPAIGIRWEGAAGTDLLGVNIYRSTTKGSGYALLNSASGDTFEDTDVRPGITYYYVVTSVDSNFNETGYSNEISVEYPDVSANEAAAKTLTEPTKMRTTKLLFRIPKVFEDGSLDGPRPGNTQDVVVDEAVGHIYVTCYEYGGILVYNMDGDFQFGIRKDGVNGDEKFLTAENVALGPNGDIYFTDYNVPMVYIFRYDGKLLNTVEVDIKHIPDYSKMSAKLYGIAVNEDGSFFVGDGVPSAIHFYNSSRKRLFDIMSDKKKGVEINGPSSMLVTKDGKLVFTNVGYSRLEVFGADGRHIRSIGKKGLGAGMLHFPVGNALGNKGEIFNASGMSPNVQAFSIDGKFLYALANEKGDGPMDVNDMRGIYIDSKDRIYIAEGLTNRVSVFQMTDKYVEVTPEL